MFKLRSKYNPTGDQPTAIKKLVNGINSGEKDQVLLGVTGSGKTFTIANIIQQVNKPTLVVAHNKTLAAQLYQEFRDFFPDNAVEYFVSYYDYYQPESYIPQTDTYIEKDAAINDEIDKLRLSTTTSLMTRKDVIVISSVSCIYNLGSPAEYSKQAIRIKTGMKIRFKDFLMRLNQIYYTRDEYDFKRSTYRVRGDIIDIYPAYDDYGLRIEIFDDILTSITYFDPITGEPMSYKETKDNFSDLTLTENEKDIFRQRQESSEIALIYPAKHYVTPEDRIAGGIEQIEIDLQNRLDQLEKAGKSIEAYRLKQKTLYDLEMIQEIGYCKGIENYSIYFDGRGTGQMPYTLLDFFPDDYLMVIDESHMTIPQIGGMQKGDFARKTNLIDYGFRLPSALDNRPLKFPEFETKINQAIYVSATPSKWELERSEDRIAEQIIRPTGIIDPTVKILPIKVQVTDLYERIKERVKRKERVLVTTLTKRMSEELSKFLKSKGIKVTYLHSDIDTLERTNILDDLRRGEYDVLVGINLLREGLDLPEVSLVAILDADKEGFLRSSSALIQTMGRAARHTLGEVIMYADKLTKSMEFAISEVDRRRKIQSAYNEKHKITPQQIVKPVREKLVDELKEEKKQKKKRIYKVDTDFSKLPPEEIKVEIINLENLMKQEAENLNFEKAAAIRDEIRKLKKLTDQ